MISRSKHSNYGVADQVQQVSVSSSSFSSSVKSAPFLNIYWLVLSVGDELGCSASMERLSVDIRAAVVQPYAENF